MLGIILTWLVGWYKIFTKDDRVFLSRVFDDLVNCGFDGIHVKADKQSIHDSMKQVLDRDMDIYLEVVTNPGILNYVAGDIYQSIRSEH